jgi:hypothetical protein
MYGVELRGNTVLSVFCNSNQVSRPRFVLSSGGILRYWFFRVGHFAEVKYAGHHLCSSVGVLSSPHLP